MAPKSNFKPVKLYKLRSQNSLMYSIKKYGHLKNQTNFKPVKLYKFVYPMTSRSKRGYLVKLASKIRKEQLTLSLLFETKNALHLCAS